MHSKKGIRINQLISSLQYTIAATVTVLFLNMPCLAAPGFNEAGLNTARDVPRKTNKQKGKDNMSESRRVVHAADGRLTVSVSGMPLGQLMDEVAGVTGVQVAWQAEQSGNAGKPISAGFTGMPIDDAIKSILQGESYMLFYEPGGENGHLTRVLILPGGEEGPEQRRRPRMDYSRGLLSVPPPPVDIAAEQFTMGISDIEREMLDRELGMPYEMEEAGFSEHMRVMLPGFVE